VLLQSMLLLVAPKSDGGGPYMRMLEGQRRSTADLSRREPTPLLGGGEAMQDEEEAQEGSCAFHGVLDASFPPL
jgi:hypothetical protein